MRGLQTKDLALFSKIISKLEIKEEVKKLFVTVDIANKTEEEIAEEIQKTNEGLEYQLVMLLVENYWKAEKEVYKLLANLTGKNIKEVQELPLADFIGLFEQLMKDDSVGLFFS